MSELEVFLMGFCAGLCSALLSIMAVHAIC